MIIRELTSAQLDDCAAIREAARGCHTVIAAPENLEQARRVIKVIAGSDVDQLVIAAPGEQAELERYASELGIDPVFIDRDAVPHDEEIRCRSFSLPVFP